MSKESLQVDLEIMDELMGAITQTDEWQRIQMEDPQIKKAQAELDLALRNVSHFVPVEVFKPLDDSVANAVFSYVDAAILYGIQVADAIHTAASRPSDLSRHVMERLAAQKG